MRPLVLLLLFASCGVLHAQVQEGGLLQRIMTPDRTLANPLQGKSYYGGAGDIDVSKPAPVKDFFFIQKFSSKSFDTKDYDTGDFWMGEFQFNTKSATVKTDTSADKFFATKTMSVKESEEANKDFLAGKTTFPTHQSGLSGKTSQNHLDEVNKGKEEMNIDQVRALLNKPRLTD
ncbi:MAG: hypothetical protein ABSE62_10805 [Chthoniobacteraceae bacterium]|jgi:hypothetical protein